VEKEEGQPGREHVMELGMCQAEDFGMAKGYCIVLAISESEPGAPYQLHRGHCMR
jgi:hypothetical protein